MVRELISSCSLVVHWSFSPFFEVCQFSDGDQFRDRGAKRPAEGLARDRGLEARACGMQPRASAGKSRRGIHHNTSIARDHPHE